MQVLNDINAVFFDMDGVLFDSMPNHEYTWIHSLKKYGINLPPEEAYMNEGRTGYATIRIAFEKYLHRLPTRDEEEAVYALKTELMATRPKAPVFPMMQELIDFLRIKGVQVFVVTGSRQASLIDKLHAHFKVEAPNIISGADVKQGKPHPEPYLMAWQRSGLPKHQCLVVENAPMGVESAKAAGLYCLAVNTGKLSDKVLIDAGADTLFKNTSSLYKAFTRR